MRLLCTRSAVLVLSALALTACSSSGATGTTEAVECVVTHRAEADGTAEEQTSSVRVTRVGDEAGEPQTTAFGELAFQVSYTDTSPGKPTVATRVSDADGNTVSRDVNGLISGGEPVGPAPDGSGYTGVQQVEQGGAQLEYYCELAG